MLVRGVEIVEGVVAVGVGTGRILRIDRPDRQPQGDRVARSPGELELQNQGGDESVEALPGDAQPEGVPRVLAGHARGDGAETALSVGHRHPIAFGKEGAGHRRALGVPLVDDLETDLTALARIDL